MYQRDLLYLTLFDHFLSDLDDGETLFDHLLSDRDDDLLACLLVLLFVNECEDDDDDDSDDEEEEYEEEDDEEEEEEDLSSLTDSNIESSYGSNILMKKYGSSNVNVGGGGGSSDDDGSCRDVTLSRKKRGERYKIEPVTLDKYLIRESDRREKKRHKGVSASRSGGKTMKDL